MNGLVDIHCHLLPGIDDGAADLEASLAMARLSVSQGVETIVVTPHQLGAFEHNHGDEIRRRTAELQAELRRHDIPLRVLPGADVRIEDNLIAGLESGAVVSLGDHRRHVLLELPHELYFPLEPVLDSLERLGMVGVLSHPERNAGLLARQDLIDSLVGYGCLMQVTAGSLIGGFGPKSQAMAERMATRGMIHFLSTDGHSPTRRRPRLGDAYRAAEQLVGEEAARLWCCENPLAVAEGRSVAAGPTQVRRPRRGWSLFARSAA
ncbi:Tyrosine-protein phosphatase YwqE [Botrimarina colliarenosi]|uniref:protein-tyrosine-phosphatase n=1 Tax=Botrimarina colliarenosi TaxID=2528001 RepID=A0A5C6A6Q3_9BACT|nr:CpsB/CapC family capsule biosynthesis tyrosine phosphatase [Botrimarina colliarenosi]TWT94023.1 Tyrosine-protein phosphatase YwqE [Botrimarina colliarenosi]